MNRVQEVVDYGISNDMYVILNSHWDGGWLEEHPFYANQDEVNAKQDSYWTQVANHFVGYDQRLLFAGTNEVRADYGEPTSEYIEVQESYNQTFIDAVRATGGNNQDRVLIVQTYNTNAWHGLNYFSEPNDPVSNRMMVEIHHYDPYDFTLNPANNACSQWDAGSCSWAGASYVEDLFTQVEQRWVNNGIPVIMGEYGAIKRDAGHEPERQEWLEFTTDAAKRHGLLPVYWDNGYAPEFALFDRATGNIIDQATVDVLMAGAGVGNPNNDYTLNISVNGSGGVVSNPSGSVHAGGTSITLSANPDSGWEFAGWSGDLSGATNPISFSISSNMNVTATFVEEGTGGTGTILREYWTGISGTSISSLTGNANYPDNPTGSEQLTSLEGPINWADNYGSRIRGYVHPSVSGTYTLWVAGDDYTELYLSTNDNPANASRVAYVNGWTNSREWDKYNTQDYTVSFVAGQKYYIEVLQKEGSGGDNVAVAWQGPGVSQSVISGNYLSPYEGGSSPTQYSLSSSTSGSGSIDFSPSGGTYNDGTVVTLTANPASGWQFSGWSGDLSGSSNPASITMNANKSVTATFTQITSNQYTLTTSVNGSGDLSLSPSGGVYDEGTVVTVVASPASGWQFDNWSGALSGSTNPATITMNSNNSVTANFSEIPTGGDPCENPTSVSLPFSFDGAGEYCWEITGNIGYINNWSVDFVEINGVDYSNVWSNSMPPKQQGKYYVHYQGSFAWSHFEAVKGNGAKQISNEVLNMEEENGVALYPNPFSDVMKIEIRGEDVVNRIEVLDISGRVIQVNDQILENGVVSFGEFLKSGQYLIRVHLKDRIETHSIIKK